jgi:ABC-type nitrate/sulfonate/bicarbonate transport system permease component
MTMALPAATLPIGSQWRGARWIFRYLPLVMFAVVWQGVVDLGVVDRHFLPSFTQTAGALWELMQNGEIAWNLWVSTYRSLGGLAIGSLLGIVLGLLMATSPAADRFFAPLVATTYSLPKSSLIPLFILWFGVGDMTTMLTVVLACLLPVIVGTYQGVKAVPAVTLWSARAMGTPSHVMLWRILLPAAMRSILTGVRLALSFCFVLTISAEMIAAKAGIGKLIFVYGESGSYPYMFGGLLAIMVVAYAADRGLIAGMDYLLRWDDSVHASAGHE